MLYSYEIDCIMRTMPMYRILRLKLSDSGVYSLHSMVRKIRSSRLCSVRNAS